MQENLGYRDINPFCHVVSCGTLSEQCGHVLNNRAARTISEIGLCNRGQCSLLSPLTVLRAHLPKELLCEMHVFDMAARCISISVGMRVLEFEVSFMGNIIIGNAHIFV